MLWTAFGLGAYLPAFVGNPFFWLGLALWWMQRTVLKGFQQTHTALAGVSENLEAIQQRLDALEKLFIEEYRRVA